MHQRRFGITSQRSMTSWMSKTPTSSSRMVVALYTLPTQRKNERCECGVSSVRKCFHSKPSSPASSLNSRCMAASASSPGSTLPPTPLSKPRCHSGFILRMRTTCRSNGSIMKPTTYSLRPLAFLFSLSTMFLNTRGDAVGRLPDVVRCERHDAIDAIGHYTCDASHPHSTCAHGAIEAVHGVSQRESVVFQALVAFVIERRHVQRRAFSQCSGLMDRVLFGVDGVARLKAGAGLLADTNAASAQLAAVSERRIWCLIEALTEKVFRHVAVRSAHLSADLGFNAGGRECEAVTLVEVHTV